MSGIETLTRTLGGIAGNVVLPGAGGLVGEAVGGLLGKVFGEFTKNPACMADPASLPSKFADGVLGELGVPRPFRSLVQFAQNPETSIRNILGGRDRCTVRPVAIGGCCCDEPGLSTNGKDTVDTGRYLITAQEGEVKIYDKQTNTWVECQGDPHLSTSDGDHGQFQKNLTIDLPDGTEVKIKVTPQDQNGVAYIDSVAVIKGDEAVVMSGFHDGQAGVNVGHVLNNADSVAGEWSDGTVLRAGRNVSDLTYASDGKEIVGGDPNGKWGEWSLDNHGGVGRYDPTPAPATSGGVSSGGSVYDKLFALLGQLEDKLNKQVDDASKIDPTKQGDIQKAMFQIQQTQNLMTQIVTTATNLLKKTDETVSTINQNLR